LRVVFLDRDGVINDCPKDGYVKSIRELNLFQFAIPAVKRLNKAGFELIVVSNQSGCAQAGARIMDFFYCPHGPDDRCDCRKPRPGLLQQALRKYPEISADESFLVGDSLRDLLAANAVGLRSFLVLTGHGLRDVDEARNLEPPPVAITRDLAEAADLIANLA